MWGAVLAQRLGGKGRDVWLWEFFPEAAQALQRSRKHPQIPGFKLSAGITATSDMARAVENAGIVFFVLPSHFVRRTARAFAQIAGGDRPFLVNASKGVEPQTLQTMGEVIASEMPKTAKGLCTLSGPSFAREVAQGVPTKMVLAGPASPAEERVRRLLSGGSLQVQWSKDRKGVELGGSLKNVLAIGCGILDGVRAGSNTKAALMIQGMGEMGKLIVRCGGKPDTIYGLAGLGDLIATGTSMDSRNRALGEKMGKGKTLKKALGEIPTVVEGIEASQSARALCRRMKVKAPLIEAIWKVLHRGGSPRLIVESLGF